MTTTTTKATTKASDGYPPILARRLESPKWIKLFLFFSIITITVVSISKQFSFKKYIETEEKTKKIDVKESMMLEKRTAKFEVNSDIYNPNFFDGAKAFSNLYDPSYESRIARKFDKLKGTLIDPCMNSIFQGTNSALCQDLHLPVNFSEDKNECLPRLVLLPSFPKSGNGLTRNLFRNITGLVTVKLQNYAQINKEHTRIFNLGAGSWDLMSNKDEICKEGGKIPFEGRIALVKTHYPGKSTTHYAELHDSFINGISQKFVAKVIRLTRNPGDHLARHLKENTKFRERECQDIVNKKMHKWKFFHTFWSKTYDPKKLKMILRYEDLYDKRKAASAMKELLEFVGETEIEEGTLDEKIQNIVLEPSYETGTLLTEKCGIQVSRTVHDFTESVSQELGYGFDKDLGKWYLMEAGTYEKFVAIPYSDNQHSN